MKSEEITVLILCYNEEKNIGRCIEKLSWFDQIICVDSFSNDGTIEILNELKSIYPIKVIQNDFSSHSEQWNFGISQVNTAFSLTLDSDYILSDNLIEELQDLELEENIDFLKASFTYMIDGEAINKSLMPARPILIRTKMAQYYQDGHTQRLHLSNNIGHLKGTIFHDDRKPFTRWKRSQKNYVQYEVQKLNNTQWGNLNANDKIRKTIFLAPIIIFFYCYFYNGLFLEGTKGIKYTYQRVFAEYLLSKQLLLSLFRRS